jgi:DNA polymerase III alpha subunit
MLAKEPDWTKLQDSDFCEKVVHIGNYHDLICAMQPDSIPRMAAFISIIRPGKSHLQRRPWQEVFATVWDGDDSAGFVFKKSHAVSYARLVALHVNLLCEQV